MGVKNHMVESSHDGTHIKRNAARPLWCLRCCKPVETGQHYRDLARRGVEHVPTCDKPVVTRPVFSAAVIDSPSGWLITDEFCLPEQFFSAQQYTTRPEHAFLLAVLQDALALLLNTKQHTKDYRARKETASWFLADDPSYLCSFVSICQHLGIEPEPLLTKLRAKLDAALSWTESIRTHAEVALVRQEAREKRLVDGKNYSSWSRVAEAVEAA